MKIETSQVSRATAKKGDTSEMTSFRRDYRCKVARLSRVEYSYATALMGVGRVLSSIIYLSIYIIYQALLGYDTLYHQKEWQGRVDASRFHTKGHTSLTTDTR